MDAFEYGAGPERPVHYLMGMRDGYLLVSNWRSPQDWKWVKLPLSFDITAICGFTLGGQDGQLAQLVGFPETQFPPLSRTLLEDLLWPQTWDITELGTAAPVVAICEAGDQKIALSGGRLFLATNDMAVWQEVTPQGVEVMDVTTLNGEFLALVTSSTGFELLSYANGSEWRSRWAIDWEQPGSSRSAGFLELENRLYVRLYLADFVVTYDGIFSTVDGEEWSDHGSFYINKAVFGRPDWNPLGLPDSRRYFLPPVWRWDPVAGGLSVTGYQTLATLQIHDLRSWRNYPVSAEGVYLYKDWLGWYRVVDGYREVIDHLEFGYCWIRPVGDRQYWIRSDQLGWIYIDEAWMPWFFRLEDGHWYWLDHYFHRFWDDDARRWTPTG